ncbi:MAG TPA: MgtC/SapB family protein [Bryobacteraceae bacterium]|nr:MgtC/SapB family protein [Bryobacteraceae bacterium]
MLDFYRALPPEGAKIILVLFLSFLTGLEREERRAASDPHSFGGVRTFPLIGLIGYAMAFLSGGQFLGVAVGFAVIGAFLMLSYHNKLTSVGLAGFTTEMSALTTYLAGALVYRDQLWIATTISVASILLLELKAALEGLTTRVPPGEILTFAKFLLLSAVILPVLPNREFGPFQINPFKAWLVVVAVSSVSYGSYVIQKLTKGKGGVILAALLGGAYSSTATTIVLARRAKRELRPHLFSGSTLIASGVMYLRLAGLVALFNRNLAAALWLPFLGLAAASLGAGWLWARLPDGKEGGVAREFEPENPLELRAAFIFGALFLAMLIATHLVVTYLGRAGVYSLALIMGCTDVDPFIMGMTQSAGSGTALTVAAAAILIAGASNNLVKGIYAYSLSDRRTGLRSLVLLCALALAGLAPLFWVLR